MAKDKTSFVLYVDQRGVFEKLTDEQAGKLIKHIFKYVGDEGPEGDFVTELAFESIKQQLKRDLKKYEERAERSRLNGLKGGRPRLDQEPRKPSGLNKNPDEPRKPDTVNDNVNDNDSINYSELMNYINVSFGRGFKTINKQTKAKYSARLKEGYTNLDIKTAIDNAVKDKFHKDNNYQYCTPEYFSRANTLDKYSQVTVKPEDSSSKFNPFG